MYIYIMSKEKTIPENHPDIKEEDLRREEDLKSAARRRDAYSLIRDGLARDNNEAIVRRLEREKKNPDEENQ